MEQKEFEFKGVAEISLSYRPNFKASQRPKVLHSRDCYRIFLAQWDLDLMELQEQFKVMLLNRANRVVGICELSKGGMSGTVVDPKLVFALALKAGACAIVLVHNHPSGDLKPSSQDVSVTKKLCEGGKLLEVEVFDHLIISADGYLSMAEEHYI